MKLGEVTLIKKVCVSRECEECGETATKKHTFLYENARRNPASSAYGKDDCSWCSDAEVFSCDKDSELLRRNKPDDMEWCSTFTRNERFEHLFLYWKEEKLNEMLASDFMKQFNDELNKGA